MYTKEKYIEEFYLNSYPSLPTDDINYLKNNIRLLSEKLHKLHTNLDLKPEPEIDHSKIENIGNLKKLHQDIGNKIKILREQIFYKNQAKKDSIKDILDYYDKITSRSLMGGEAYRPAFLEWTTWRLFLAINDIHNDISTTRNFNIDEEMNPIHHAKSGAPDMVFEYNEFIIVCEVTLRSSANQWAEQEPVPRHVGKVVQDFRNKKVYGIFIAPSIDPNTVIEFYNKKQYSNGKMFDINIIPLTIDQIKNILIKFDKSRFSTNNMKELLEKITLLQNSTNDAIEWQKELDKYLNSWISN